MIIIRDIIGSEVHYFSLRQRSEEILSSLCLLDLNVNCQTSVPSSPKTFFNNISGLYGYTHILLNRYTCIL